MSDLKLYEVKTFTGSFHGYSFKSSPIGQAKEKEPGIAGSFSLVRTRGLEPPQPFDHYHLKVARLPIPPRPRSK